MFALQLRLNSKRCEFSYGSGAPVKERRTEGCLDLFTSLTSVDRAPWMNLAMLVLLAKDPENLVAVQCLDVQGRISVLEKRI